MIDAPQALVITGVYGVGKTTTAAQIADLLEERGAHYAALDLDWLSWAWTMDDPDGPVGQGGGDGRAGGVPGQRRVLVHDRADAGGGRGPDGGLNRLAIG